MSDKFRVIQGSNILNNSSISNYDDKCLLVDKAGGLYLGNGTTSPFIISEKNNELKTINGQSILGSGDLETCMILTTYSELKSLRDNSQLIPGMQYHITDYVTTTVQVNTLSAGHQFDIIVIADNENTLNENARACLHEGDTYFSDAGANLESWELKYSLDNDINKFAWANTTNGKGVIYYMKDEWNNECPYDFKNIMFTRYELNAPETLGYGGWVDKMAENIQAQFTAGSLPYIWGGLGDGEDRYWEDDYGELYSAPTGGSQSFYTFSNIIKGVVTDKSITNNYCYSNVIKERIISSKISLNNIVFFNTSSTFSCHSNSFGNNCYNNSFGTWCESNSFEVQCYYNSFGYGCSANSFGSWCNFNSFGDDCYSNSFGYTCNNNSFGDGCYSNSFGFECYFNSFGNSCNNNSFGDSCYSNLFGNNCYFNSFGSWCDFNSFGNSSSDLKNYYIYNSFGCGCAYINLANDETSSFSNQVKNYKIVQGLRGTSSSRITIIAERNRDYETRVARNSAGEIKVYCEADLIA